MVVRRGNLWELAPSFYSMGLQGLNLDCQTWLQTCSLALTRSPLQRLLLPAPFIIIRSSHDRVSTQSAASLYGQVWQVHAHNGRETLLLSSPTTFTIPPGTKKRTVSSLSHLGSLPCSTVCLKPDKLSINHSLPQLHGTDGKDAGKGTEGTACYYCYRM